MYELRASPLLYAKFMFHILLTDPFHAGCCLAKGECNAFSAFMTLPFFIAVPAILVLWQPVGPGMAMLRAFLLGAWTAGYAARVHVMIEAERREVEGEFSSFMEEFMARAEPALRRAGRSGIAKAKEAIVGILLEKYGMRVEAEEIEVTVEDGGVRTNVPELLYRWMTDESESDGNTP